MNAELPSLIYWLTALVSVPIAGAVIAIAVRAKSILGWVAAVSLAAVAIVDIWTTLLVNSTPLPPSDCGPMPDLSVRPECDYPVRLLQATSLVELRVVAYVVGVTCVIALLWSLTKRRHRADA